MARVNPESRVLKSYVRGWMRNNLRSYVDRCGEINCTLMAENAADEFDVYLGNPEYTIPTWVFDEAVDAVEYGRTHALL
jgi:hypothetical protein